MNVITVSREYGAGGSDVARRLAETLGWELLDRELLHRAAAVGDIPDSELEHLDEKGITLADRLRRHPLHQRYMHALAQVVHQAADRGNVVLVGRGSRHLLGNRGGMFCLRLVAPRDVRVSRVARGEGWSEEQALERCPEVDRTRDHFTRYFFGNDANRPFQYDLVVNTGRVPLDDVVALVLNLVRGPEPAETAEPLAGLAPAGPGRRVLTLSREMGAGDTGFAPTLAARLGLKVYDRELLEEQAVRLGVTEKEIERVDEHPAALYQQYLPDNLYQRYFDTLGKLMGELAARGGVLLVGRGGSRFLRDHPGTFHVRLTATLEVRVQRVMEHRWLREEAAQVMVLRSNDQRRHFYQDYFGADWFDPLEYHLTVNSGRLGASAVDLIAQAAELSWRRGLRPAAAQAVQAAQAQAQAAQATRGAAE
jgi:cytidylate kinase